MRAKRRSILQNDAQPETRLPRRGSKSEGGKKQPADRSAGCFITQAFARARYFPVDP
jgi:hypothetical protein